MELTTYIFLSVAAFIPAIFYMLYIIAFDSEKPEPPKALIAAAVVGVAMAAAVTMIGVMFVDVHIGAILPLKDSLTMGFLGLAVPAELTKWVSLLAFLTLNKYYDEYIDGIVYSVCLAMGFAGVWSVWFVSILFGAQPIEVWEMCLFIIIVLMPIHLAAGSMMGYFLALARTKHKIRNYLLSLILPTIISGALCTMVIIIGARWEYYFVAGILFSLLSMIFYTQTFRLLELDGVKTASKKK